VTASGPQHPHDDLAALAVGALTRAEADRVRATVARSPDVAAELARLREAAAALPSAVLQIDPPASLKARVMAIAGEPAAPATTSAAQPAAVALRPRPAVPNWLALAATAVLAFGLLLYAWQLRGRVDALDGQLADATIQLANAEADMRDARTRLVRAQAETAVLAAPDLARIDLAGQSGADNAVARAFWSRSHGLVFTATRLPDLPRGRTYQLWVLTDDAPISAGVFRADADGRASAVFDTPVSLPSPTGMAVSIEPEGGVPAPTGEIVLLGKPA
jgi:anti-sigma-K factor RskA